MPGIIRPAFLFWGMAERYDDPVLRFAQELELQAAKRVEGFLTGKHKSPFQGFSVEFAEHRPYNAGESIRHMDWKLLARTDKHYIKRYEAETNLRCYLAVDVSGSMHYPKRDAPSLNDPNKLSFSTLSSAALMHLLKKQRDAFGLALFGQQVEHLSPAKLGTLHHKSLLNSLARITYAEAQATDLPACLHELAERIPSRSMVVLFSDWLQDPDRLKELEAALQHIRFCGHDLIVFHVHDRKTEMELDIGKQTTRLIDLETGEELRVEPSQIRAPYQKLLDEYRKSIKGICKRAGADWFEADVALGVQPLLLQFLRKRKQWLR